MMNSRRGFFSLVALFLLCGLFAGAAQSAGVTARQVIDLNRRTGDSFPNRLTQLPNAVLLAADSGTQQNLPYEHAELWRSDGTTDGTYQLGDVTVRRPFSSDEWPVLNGMTLFQGYDHMHGFALWRSDGTQAGTRLVHDFAPDATDEGVLWVQLIGDTWYVQTGEQTYSLRGEQLVLLPVSGRAELMVEFGRNLLFVTNQQLWRTDGTVSGTQLLTDLPNRRTYAMYQTATHLYLKSGSQLLATDGTTVGTQVMQDGIDRIFFVDDHATLSDNLAFPFIIPFAGNRFLLRTDGTVTGTFPIHPIDDNSLVNSLFEIGDKRYYLLADYDTPTALWRTDGTAAGTEVVMDTLPERIGLFGQAENGVALLYGINQLWRTDGTAAGTVALATDLTVWSSSPIVHNGLLHFLTQSANDLDAPLEMWRFDGISAETFLTFDPLYVYPHGTAAFYHTGSMYYILAQPSNATGGVEGYTLWGIDLDTGDATRLADNVQYAYGSDPGGSLSVGNDSLLMFVTESGTIWRTDGTPAGTFQLAQTARRTSTDYPIGFLGEINGRWLFTGNDAQRGVELWATDGTPANTQLIKDIAAVSAASNPTLLQRVGNRVCFIVEDDGYNHNALYCTDGATTYLVESRQTTNEYGSRFNGGLIGSQLYYVLRTDDGIELWRTNGTLGGTFFTGVTTSVHFDPLTSATTSNGIHYYILLERVEGQRGSRNPSYGYQLWRTDGTPGGTRQVHHLGEAVWYLAPHQLTAVGNHVYFYAYSAEHGMELWRTDGWNTHLVKDIHPTGSSKPTWTTLEMVAVNGTLYFLADDGTHGRELWRSNGTADSTYMVRDIQPGHSWLKNLTPVGNRLFFTPATTAGYELWTSYGTWNGTYMVKDINVPWGSAEPQNLTAYHDGVLFSAEDGTHGRQLWRSDGTANGTWCLHRFPRRSHLPPHHPHVGCRLPHPRRQHYLAQRRLHPRHNPRPDR